MKNKVALIFIAIAVAAIAIWLIANKFYSSSQTSVRVGQNKTSLNNSSDDKRRDELSSNQADQNRDMARESLMSLENNSSNEQRYSFKYPRYLIKQASAEFNLGYINKVVSADSFTHIINSQYCSLAGKCEDTTKNFTVYKTELNLSKRDLMQSRSADEFTAKIHPINNQQYYIYQIGAEGEGMIYYFIPKPDNVMVVLALKYIDESVLINYRNDPKFIKFEDQKQIFNQIFNSLN